MRLDRPRTRERAERPHDGDLPARALRPQPEHAEPTLADPEPVDLSWRDYVAIVRRAGRSSLKNNITNLAAALAYYAFLAIPSALLVGVGLFSLLAGPHAVNQVVDRLDTILPREAITLIRHSLTQMTTRDGTGATLIGVGGLLAVWSLGGAMQNVMWALNAAYGREETRGFVRRRLTAWAMLLFAVTGLVLAFGLLVLGPQLSRWVGDAVGARHAVTIVWWAAQWPILLLGMLVAFAGILFLGPNVEHPRWRFLSVGAVVAVALWLASSAIFAFYVSRFGSYNKTWGALSAIVILLTWLWLSGVALLLGAEINAEAERSRELRRDEPAEVDLQAPRKT